MNTVTWNRLEDECCVACGDKLISPKDAVMAMCTSCLKNVTKASMKQIKNHKNRKGSVRQFKVAVAPHLVAGAVKKK